jgi:hypothetical protein
MRSAWIIGAAAAFAGGAQAAELYLDEAVARVVIIPESRSDIAVTVQQGRAPIALRVSRQGDRTVVHGGYQTNQCSNRNGSTEVRLRRGGTMNMEDAPLVTVRAPRSLTVRTRGGAVHGRVGALDNLTLSAGGCSQWSIADVAGTIDLNQSGGATATVGRARTARLGASGGGTIRAQSVGSLDADASGGGVVRVASVNGAMSADASGGGGVKVEGGRTGLLRAGASGGGWVDYDGVADSLDAEASGGGRVNVARVLGQVNRRASGGGHVSVGR